MPFLLVKLAFLLLIGLQQSFGFFGLTNKYNTHLDPFIGFNLRTLPQYNVQEKWIEQKLNHFDLHDNRTWKMRYLENNVFFKPNGPIFIYVGGEWTISGASISPGNHFYDMAKDFHANLFYTEHRYYGQSHPTQNTSTENLKFLSVEQALADLAHFVVTIKSSSSSYKNSKVIMAGGSYSATMVAWFRQKYPHLADGVWASSAPLFAKADFSEYKEVMTRSIELMGGEICREQMKNAFEIMEDAVKAKNTSEVEKAFNLCSPLDHNKDIAHFFYEISDIVAGLVQGKMSKDIRQDDYGGQTINDQGHRPGEIERACITMERQREMYAKNDMESFAAWATDGDIKCLDMSYTNNINKFRNIIWGSEANKQMRQWTYQTCAEFAWFQTSTSREQIFGTLYPLSYFIGLCEDLYDFKFNHTIVEENVKKTNVMYGGFNPAITNAYFTHGELDPWQQMGILEDLNKMSPAFVIPRSSHVPDHRSISNNDSMEMIQSKEKIRELIREWLQ